MCRSATRAVTADLEGRYTSLPLPPGEYRVEACSSSRAVRRWDHTVQPAAQPVSERLRAVARLVAGLLTQAGAGLQAPLRDTPSPWTIQFNVNVQRELPWGMFVEAAYVGTRGHDLSIAGEGGFSLNQLDPQYMSLGSQLNQQVPNPFFGIVNNGVLASPTVSRAQLLRPYPQFTDIVPLYASGAKSRYNALQLTGRKRLSHGLMFEGSYTFAKAEEIGMGHQNSYDLEASWALASYDINHRVVLSYLYEIPIGRNRRFFDNAPAAVNALIGGWQFNGIMTFQAGTPLSITANNTAGIFGARTQPNNNGGDPRLDGSVEDRLGRYFDTSVYSQPAAFQFGNEPIFSPGGPFRVEFRTLGAVVAPNSRLARTDRAVPRCRVKGRIGSDANL